MLIIDSEASEARYAYKYYENEQQRYSKWLNEHAMLCNYNDDPETSPLAAAKKIGKPMLHTEMERRLKRLNPNLTFMTGPLNTKHKVLCRPWRIGDPARTLDLADPFRDLIKLFVYPTGVLPERSIWRECDEWVPDPSYVPTPGDVDQNDWEWVPLKGHETQFITDPLRPGAGKHGHWQRKAEDKGRAGWKKLKHAWGEKQRGWRTVLLQLVKLHLLTVQQVEDEFLSDNTPEWARHTGKQNIFRPW
jgi:hypothetical protein